MRPPSNYDIFTQTLSPSLAHDESVVGATEALKFATAGQTIVTVDGTAIAGTRTSATRFTRTAGTWNQTVIILISAITPSGVNLTFQLGETVTESSSSKTGVVLNVNTTQLTLGTLSGNFTGGLTLTGGTTGVTATGGVAAHQLQNLAGKLVWSHASGTLTAGTWLMITKNTAAYLDVSGTLHATGTAVIIVGSAADARAAMDLTYGS